MSATILKKITAEAKRIRKKSPRTSWQSAVKQAGAKYRKSAKKKVGKAPAKKAAKKRVTGYNSLYKSNQMIGAVKKVSIAQMKSSVIAEIGKLEAKKFAAKLVRDKKAIAKRIAEKKKLYRKLQ